MSLLILFFLGRNGVRLKLHFIFSECSLAAKLASLQTSMSLTQRPPPPKWEQDDFHYQLNSSTSASKNIKWIYMFDATTAREERLGKWGLLHLPSSTTGYVASFRKTL